MYNKAMMPGTNWQTGHKGNCDGGMYRQTRKPGPLVPMYRTGFLARLLGR